MCLWMHVSASGTDMSRSFLGLACRSLAEVYVKGGCELRVHFRTSFAINAPTAGMALAREENLVVRRHPPAPVSSYKLTPSLTLTTYPNREFSNVE